MYFNTESKYGKNIYFSNIVGLDSKTWLLVDKLVDLGIKGKNIRCVDSLAEHCAVSILDQVYNIKAKVNI